jgi:putative FmdB family regulatory protein
VPIFDHRCKTCGHTWEAFVHRRDSHPPCPKCGGETAQAHLPPAIVPAERVFRTTSEIKKRVTGDIRELNKRLLEAANRVAILLQKHKIASTPQGAIMIALYKKVVNTFRGIQMLKTERLIEESWILLRVLLEAHINLVYFLQDDTTEKTRRWADALILEKLKYLKEVHFFEGTELEALNRRTDNEQAESDIVQRYSNDELKALKRFGFSGMSVQQRAESIGLLRMYQDVYRIASRSVHSFDPAETGIVERSETEQSRTTVLAARRETLESTQNMLLGRVSIQLSSAFVDDPVLKGELMLLGLGYEKYRDNKDGVSTTDSEVDPGTFYIWRA